MTDSESAGEKTRRDFLCAGMAAAAAAALGGCALFVRKAKPGIVVGMTGGEFRVPLDHFPALAQPGGSLVVEVTGMSDKVLVFRLPSGELGALNMTCTHRGCDVEYRADRDRIVCPCHGSEYDTAGRNLKGPALLPLASYVVRRQGNDLVVRIS